MSKFNTQSNYQRLIIVLKALIFSLCYFILIAYRPVPKQFYGDMCLIPNVQKSVLFSIYFFFIIINEYLNVLNINHITDT